MLNATLDDKRNLDLYLPQTRTSTNRYIRISVILPTEVPLIQLYACTILHTLVKGIIQKVKAFPTYTSVYCGAFFDYILVLHLPMLRKY